MKKHITVLLAVALAFGAMPLLAEVRPAPYVIVHYDTIDPAQSEAWSENNKAWVEVFQKAKAGKDYHWRAYQNGFTFAWVSDMPNFGYLDDSEARDKALNEMLGEGVLDRLEAGTAPAIVGHHSEIWKFEPDLSYWPQDFDASKMTAIKVSIDTVRPGKGETFQELVKEAAAAMRKTNAEVNWFAYSIPFGMGSYVFVSWAADNAALHSAPNMRELLTSSLGAEKAQAMYSSWLKHVTNREETSWSVRKDLAYVSD